jgi:hypothetical protein
MIVSQKELISFMCFLFYKKNKIKMVILIFRGNKSEDLEIFLREYK